MWKSLNFILLLSLFVDEGCGAELFRVSSDPVRAIQGSNVFFQWTLSEDITSRHDFQGLVFGVWKNGFVASYILSVEKNGKIIFNTGLNEEISNLVGRVHWRGDLSKSLAAFEISHISVQDQMDYGLQLDFGALKESESDFVKLEVEAQGKSVITAIPSPPLTVPPGKNASFQCEFYVGDADKSVYDGVTVGLWQRGGIFLTLLTLTENETLIINPKLDEEAPKYSGRVNMRQWANKTSNTSVISVQIDDVKKSDKRSYGCSMFFGPFREPLGAFASIDVQDPNKPSHSKLQAAKENVSSISFKIRVDEDIKIPCPVLSEVIRLDGTFKAVYWSYCSSKECSTPDTKWSWIAGMNSKGMTKAVDQGPYASRVNITLNGTLEITQAKSSDTTDYRCTVRRINHTSPRVYFVALEVDSSVRPKITTRSSSKVTVQEGSVLYLKCKAKGVPKPLVIWKKNGQTIQNKTDNTNFIRENANKDDSGKYECAAYNSAGFDSYQVEAIIEGKSNEWDIYGPIIAVTALIIGGIVFCIWKKKCKRNNPRNAQVTKVLI